MKKNEIITLLFVSMLVVLIFSCAAPSMRVRILKPAEINLKAINKIAIGDIAGRASSEVTEELLSQLFRSGRYEILDRQHLEEIFKEHKLTYSGAIDEETASEIGKLIGNAALIFGRVSLHNYSEETKTEDWKDQKGRSHRTYNRNGKAKVAMTLQVTDLRTGKIVAIKNLEETVTELQSNTDEKADTIDSNELLSRARYTCISRFMKAIAPYYVYEKVNFERAQKMPEVNKGIQFVKTGDLTRALEQFQVAVDKYPGNVKPVFNLGLTYMCIGDYDNAIQFLDKAYAANPTKKYASELKKAKLWRADNLRAEKQFRDAK